MLITCVFLVTFLFHEVTAQGARDESRPPLLAILPALNDRIRRSLRDPATLSLEDKLDLYLPLQKCADVVKADENGGNPDLIYRSKLDEMRTRAFDRIDSFLNGEELDAVRHEINNDVDSPPVRAVFQHLHSVRWQEQLYAVTILSVFKSMYDKYENPTRRGLLKFLIWDFSNTGDGNSYTLQNPAGQPTILPQETQVPDDSSRTSEESFRRSDVVNLIWWLLDHVNWQSELNRLNQELAEQQRMQASMNEEPLPWMASQGPQEMPEA
ncbi:hypothetical protein RF11_05947 [Thelohanellus kitauei]|uniref:Uncharacterized protein n=1 Tax=Thelohanellus kitauei TaxID=669202 RepID=A0A0C2MCU9_THEKT|nr:hypothetical protein RF11_05947 [Thelohanellus kitauei]